MSRKRKSVNILIWIDAGFACGGVWKGANAQTWRTAPIFAYMQNWPITKIVQYCNKRKWNHEISIE